MDYRSSLFAFVAFALVGCIIATPTTTPPTTPTTPPTPPTTPPTTPDTPTTSPTPPTTPAPPTPPPTTPPTTTPSPVTTTAAPTPAHERGNWTVPGDNVTCIIAEMVVSAKIVYPLEEVNKTAEAEIMVPKSAKASGSCDNHTQNLMLTWGENSLDINFEKNDTQNVYYVNQIVLSVVADEKTFPNISTKKVNETMKFQKQSEFFKTIVDQSYRCVREESLPLSEGAVLVLNKVQLQAFHNKYPAVFGSAQDCELDTPDIVPIAVGCALAALVFVVLVAYLVGRRRSQARGYLSIFLD